ncbi:hypothetical protein DQ238_21505 [Geodermatophilus sp. TF02-6]|uniref:WXG100 family type VII secretion target n=1 Tax=Geodermatophilus sp. TF02-6 TaxID=2250575 RepID=UPI000DEBB47B|nr:WXG100 family type VII secretion target [Geodermatophilus sp. TF02-6]RBY74662.1 hypothetical protein DQ238_21505 [Geodermatophilus sp. TF02-6]
MSTITVEPDAVDALATDLTGLAGEMARGADTCRSAATAFGAALGGDVGAAASSAARAWSASLDSLAQHVGTISAALVSLAAEYRVADAALAAGLDDSRRPAGGPR